MNEENTETKPDNNATPDSVSRVVRHPISDTVTNEGWGSICSDCLHQKREVECGFDHVMDVPYPCRKVKFARSKHNDEMAIGTGFDYAQDSAKLTVFIDGSERCNSRDEVICRTHR